MDAQLPLAGVRFCDFTWVGAGSFATKVFADYGAEVIKIESATRPDVLRITPPFKDGKSGLNRSGYFSNRNTSKKSLSVNLSTPEGVEVVKQVIALSDVVSNNFTPGTMDKWGLGYEGCRQLKPDIIFLSMPMHGSDGPHSRHLGYGAMIGALTGFLDQTRYPGTMPMGTGTNYPDHCPNPYHAALAVLAALRHRRCTGEGQNIELSQVESTISVMGPLVMAAVNLQQPPAPIADGSFEVAPHGVYPCAGPDRWIAIACRNQQEWAGLCRLAPQLAADQRFGSPEGRIANRDELNRLMRTWTATQDRYQLMAQLQSASVPAGAVQDPVDLLRRDPQLAHLQHWVRLDHPEMGESIYDAPPARLHRTPAQLRLPAPLLGQHTREVLTELLGMSAEEIDRLEQAGVLK